MSEKFLIVGLGNPGRKYKAHRHNVGFQVIDFLASRRGLSFSRMQNKAFTASGNIRGQSVVLAKPQSFMNRSGVPVSGLLKFYKIPLSHLLVIYDDLDLPVGTIRMRPEGGAGGQKGMKDIIQRVGGQSFARMRIGIDRPPGRMDPAAYVLRRFGRAQRPVIEAVYSQASDAVEMWLIDGIELAMNRFNGSVER